MRVIFKQLSKAFIKWLEGSEDQSHAPHSPEQPTTESGLLVEQEVVDSELS